MSKFDRILSDSELLDVYRSLDNPKRDRDSVIEAMGAAVDAAISKLAEQEPVAWTSSKIFGHYVTHDTKATSSEWFKESLDVPLYAHPCISHASDKTVCVSENAESDTQTSSQVNLDSSNQEDSQELPPLPEPNCKHGGGVSYFDSYSKEQMIEYAKSAIEHHRTAKNYIPDTSKMIAPEGHMLVPVEPTEEMLKAGGHVNSEWLNDNAPIGESRYAMPMKSVYQTMLAAAPKYTGESK